MERWIESTRTLRRQQRVQCGTFRPISLPWSKLWVAWWEQTRVEGWALGHVTSPNDGRVSRWERLLLLRCSFQSGVQCGAFRPVSLTWSKLRVAWWEQIRVECRALGHVAGSEHLRMAWWKRFLGCSFQRGVQRRALCPISVAWSKLRMTWWEQARVVCWAL